MKKGFTLIEVLIVVSVTVLIIASISGIMSGVFISQSKNKAGDKITQNGVWILNELKKNVLNIDNNNSKNGGKFTCPVNTDGSSIVITSIKDGERTTIKCLDTIDGYKIASISGKTGVGTTIYLFQGMKDIMLRDCNTFVSCSTLPSSELSNVKFNFTLEAGMETLSIGLTKNFSIDVTLRN
ncbi:MAG: type II secretion system protein [Candidatus Shapirobacteria bacterium]|nr:type II secretion system protein [Candidatus Shapirobacteria bacterium]